MASIEPYNVSVSESAIQRLHKKLEAADFPDELDEAGWDYGASLADVKRLTTYWKDQFNWKEQEAKLNELPHFKTQITVDGFETLNIHFLHLKSNADRTIPLLFIHGWPGSFLEATKILRPLAEGIKDGPAFHVVAPSLPNYGFSSGTKNRGFALPQYAETCHKLMLALGYDQYVTQGGDWGCMTSRIMGLLYPSHVKASHINMVRGHPPTLTSNPILYLKHALFSYNSRETYGFDRTKWFTIEGAGYRTQQSTKPQTLGYALADSPVGLLAWVYEKLHDWTDKYSWTDDEILTWVSIYWFSTAGPAANLRIYYEASPLHCDPAYSRDVTEKYIPKVKLGLAHFPKELSVVPKTWGRTMGPVVYESEHLAGGHFAAWEQPQAILDDLRAMFGRKGGAYGAVEGKDGS
ncbi:uncharacterized protein KY384_005387 [Bacidia gigantensis]|uniref:uncharacterized protein n=1 Tax=Bacidia gigantensis TaxID=2732470 RepID=UPI001D053368|nr:uncharacterized protein KY384_005387 [Bacidia gigantensis]KAG8529906.1 hypothetical protein KY384_005387 [Bacidia gigantensis]